MKWTLTQIKRGKLTVTLVIFLSLLNDRGRLSRLFFFLSHSLTLIVFETLEYVVSFACFESWLRIGLLLSESFWRVCNNRSPLGGLWWRKKESSWLSILSSESSMGRHMLLSHWPFFPQSKKKLRGVELNCLYCFADTGPLMLMVGNPEKEPKIKWAYKKRTANKQWTVTFTYFDNFDHFFFSCQDGEKMEFWFLSFFGHQDQSFDVSPSAFYSFLQTFEEEKNWARLQLYLLFILLWLMLIAPRTFLQRGNTLVFGSSEKW